MYRTFISGHGSYVFAYTFFYDAWAVVTVLREQFCITVVTVFFSAVTPEDIEGLDYSNKQNIYSFYE